MLLHPTLETLAQLRLDGMLKALQEQLDMPQIQTLSFEERLGLLLDRELTTRENRRLKTRLKPDYSPYLPSPTPRWAAIASTKSAARWSPIQRVWGPGKPSDFRPRKPPRPATIRTI